MTYWSVVSHPGPVERAILDELAPTFRHRRIVGAGVTLRYLEGGVGDPAIVLLHGRGHAATTWWPLLPALAARHRVVAFDLPGFGHSAARPFRGGPSDGLAFFADPVGAAARELGLEGAVFVGHSLGGLVALALTLDGAIHPAGLVLVDAMGLSDALRPRARAYFRAGPERVARLYAPIRRATGWLGDAPIPRHAALRAELLTVRGGRPEASAAFDAMCPWVGAPLHRKDALGRLAVPTLLVWGRHDDAFPLDVAAEAARRIPGAELVILDAGHAPHVERPDDVARTVARFVDRLAR